MSMASEGRVGDGRRPVGPVLCPLAAHRGGQVGVGPLAGAGAVPEPRAGRARGAEPGLRAARHIPGVSVWQRGGG